MTRTGYIIAPQAAIEITTDDYGDVTLAQGGNRIVIRSSATLAEIIIDIDNGRNAFDDDPIDDGPEDDEPPTTPVNSNGDVNNGDVNNGNGVNSHPVNNGSGVNTRSVNTDRKVYMREYMRKRRHQNGAHEKN